jgi:hypothetical protein
MVRGSGAKVPLVDPVDQWIAIVDRTGLLLLSAEGPYVRYGMPRYITIRRRPGHYEVDWAEAGDGVGVPASGRERLDRAGLEHYLRALLENDRPVRHSETEAHGIWPRIDMSIVLGLLLAGGLVWLLWIAFFR